jgi:hypothetical protein
MLSSHLKDIISRRLDVEKQEQLRAWVKEITIMKEEASRYGRLGSSAWLSSLTEKFGTFIKARGDLVWSVVVRTVSIGGVEDIQTLAEDLRAIVDLQLEENHHEISELFSKEFGAYIARNSATYFEELNRARSQSQLKISSEIDLFVVSLKRRMATSNEKDQANVFNIYSPVGTIQTGTGSIAHVTQNVDTASMQALSQAFDSVERALHTIRYLDLPREQEVVELVREGSAEVQKDSPNMIKINTYIMTIASIIQGIGALGPAYALLKSAALPFGIVLP